MKLIRSIVRPSKVDNVKQALGNAQVPSMTVTEVKDHGPHTWHTEVWRGHEYKLNFLPMMEIDVVVHDDDVDEIVAVIMRTARTAGISDGYIAVIPLEHRYNIHTGVREVC